MGITPSPPVRGLPDVNKQPARKCRTAMNKIGCIAERKTLWGDAGTGYVLVLHALFRYWWTHGGAWRNISSGTMERSYLTATFVI